MSAGQGRSAVLPQIRREGRQRLRAWQANIPLRFRRTPVRVDARSGRHTERHSNPSRDIQVLRRDARASGRPDALRRKAHAEAVHSQHLQPARDRFLARASPACRSRRRIPDDSVLLRRHGALAWTMPAGALPAGVRLDVKGTISGVPRRAGVYRFAATATDALLRVATYVRTITVAPTLRVRTQRLPTARVGSHVQSQALGNRGVAPKVWKVKRGRLLTRNSPRFRAWCPRR